MLPHSNLAPHSVSSPNPRTLPPAHLLLRLDLPSSLCIYLWHTHIVTQPGIFFLYFLHHFYSPWLWLTFQHPNILPCSDFSFYSTYINFYFLTLTLISTLQHSDILPHSDFSFYSTSYIWFPHSDPDIYIPTPQHTSSPWIFLLLLFLYLLSTS